MSKSCIVDFNSIYSLFLGVTYQNIRNFINLNEQKIKDGGLTIKIIDPPPMREIERYEFLVALLFFLEEGRRDISIETNSLILHDYIMTFFSKILVFFSKF